MLSEPTLLPANHAASPPNVAVRRATDLTFKSCPALIEMFPPLPRTSIPERSGATPPDASITLPVARFALVLL